MILHSQILSSITAYSFIFLFIAIWLLLIRICIFSILILSIFLCGQLEIILAFYLPRVILVILDSVPSIFSLWLTLLSNSVDNLKLLLLLLAPLLLRERLCLGLNLKQGIIIDSMTMFFSSRYILVDLSRMSRLCRGQTPGLISFEEWIFPLFIFLLSQKSRLLDFK